MPKNVIKFCVLLILSLCCSALSAAYLVDVSTTLDQPDGSKIELLRSGDEYHNWLHDHRGFTVLQSPETGFYVYAEKRASRLVSGLLVVGRDDPQAAGLTPGLNIDEQEYLGLRKSRASDEQRLGPPLQGTMNNIVIYVRFSDQEEFNLLTAGEESRFNSLDPAVPSVRGFYRENSYQALDVISHFLPTQTGTTIISFQDTYPQTYYTPHNEVTNPLGYIDTPEYQESADRESALLTAAINHVSAMLPSGIDWDVNDDGMVDNLTLFIRGGGNGRILYPHQSIGVGLPNLGGLAVSNFNIIVEQRGQIGVICHELGHTLGAPDLYSRLTSFPPVGAWDVMASTNEAVPQHFGAYTKYRYLGFIDTIPEISLEQAYSLNPLSMANNNAYRVNTAIPNQFFILEYRKQEGLYESGLPSSGLVIWRIFSELDGLGNATHVQEYPLAWQPKTCHLPPAT